MPPVTRIVRCFKCDTFQVDVEKDSKKWRCTVCNEKQSLRIVYSSGIGKDCCKKLVQELNELRLKKDNSLNKKLELISTAASADKTPAKQTPIALKPSCSKWDRFIDKSNEMSSDEDESAQVLPPKKRLKYLSKAVGDGNVDHYSKEFSLKPHPKQTYIKQELDATIIKKQNILNEQLDSESAAPQIIKTPVKYTPIALEPSRSNWDRFIDKLNQMSSDEDESSEVLLPKKKAKYLSKAVGDGNVDRYSKQFSQKSFPKQAHIKQGLDASTIKKDNLLNEQLERESTAPQIIITPVRHTPTTLDPSCSKWDRFTDILNQMSSDEYESAHISPPKKRVRYLSKAVGDGNVDHYSKEFSVKSLPKQTYIKQGSDESTIKQDNSLNEKLELKSTVSQIIKTPAKHTPTTLEPSSSEWDRFTDMLNQMSSDEYKPAHISPPKKKLRYLSKAVGDGYVDHCSKEFSQKSHPEDIEKLELNSSAPQVMKTPEKYTSNALWDNFIEKLKQMSSNEDEPMPVSPPKMKVKRLPKLGVIKGEYVDKSHRNQTPSKKAQKRPHFSSENEDDEPSLAKYAKKISHDNTFSNVFKKEPKTASKSKWLQFLDGNVHDKDSPDCKDKITIKRMKTFEEATPTYHTEDFPNSPAETLPTYRTEIAPKAFAEALLNFRTQASSSYRTEPVPQPPPNVLSNSPMEGLPNSPEDSLPNSPAQALPNSRAQDNLNWQMHTEWDSFSEPSPGRKEGELNDIIDDPFEEFEYKSAGANARELPGTVGNNSVK